MNDPLVSVVIPTYYRNYRLRLALSSIASQEYENLEIIVVDGSSDGRARVVVDEFNLAQYKEQAAFEGIQGAAGGRDIGIAEADGDLIRFLDDDDRFKDPTAIQKQVDVYNSSDSIGVVYSGLQWEEGPMVLPDLSVRGNVLEHALKLQTAPCIPSTMLVEQAIFEDIQPLESLVHDDAAMTIELAMRSEFEFVDEPLIIRGVSEDSLGGSRSSLEGRKKIIGTYQHLYDQFPSEVQKTALGRLQLQEAQFHLKSQIWSAEAIRSLLLANYYFPGINIPSVGALLASLLGRPGWEFGFKVYSDYITGQNRRGNIGKLDGT